MRIIAESEENKIEAARLPFKVFADASLIILSGFFRRKRCVDLKDLFTGDRQWRKQGLLRHQEVAVPVIEWNVTFIAEKKVDLLPFDGIAIRVRSQ